MTAFSCCLAKPNIPKMLSGYYFVATCGAQSVYSNTLSLRSSFALSTIHEQIRLDAQVIANQDPSALFKMWGDFWCLKINVRKLTAIRLTY
jgi:hypothetical protein